MTSLVIPVAVEPRNETLPLALASVARHAPWLEPVLVGEPIICERFVPPERVIPFMQQDPGKPNENTTRMLALVCVAPDELVTDPFAWSNDDIYVRRPVTLDELVSEGETAKGKLVSQAIRSTYGKYAHATAAALDARHRPAWDYERHVPLVVYKREMLRALDLPNTSPRSAYQNLRLDAPDKVRPDVKAFKAADLAGLADEPVFSTGKRFPIPELVRFLGLG